LTGFEIRSLGAAFYCAHGVEDGLNHRFVADGGIQHQVIEGTSRPIRVEVLNVGDAFTINRVHQVLRFCLIISVFHQPTNFLRAWL
jgi:hypothetical protein